MLYIHEDNFKTKIKSNYNGVGKEIEKFYKEIYLPTREKIEKLEFSNKHIENFRIVTNIFNEYSSKINSFASKNNIKSQSKFESTFLEEISVYLFKDLPEIKNGKYDIFNKKIYAGLKIDNNDKIVVIPKDVDFCIGKKVKITITNQEDTDLILPIVCVEVKTYLDATMFGEIKSSSRALRSGSPNSKTYVLMGHKELADEHIIAARQDSYLTEMFCLRASASSPIDHIVIYDYWNEIQSAVSSINEDISIEVPGRLLFPFKTVDN